MSIETDIDLLGRSVCGLIDAVKELQDQMAVVERTEADMVISLDILTNIVKRIQEKDAES